MKSVKARFLIAIFTLVAFFAPLMTVLAVEHTKRSREMRADFNAMKKEAEDARYQYYLEISEHRNNIRQAMDDAKKQYEQLLTNQSQIIKDNQSTVTKTTTKPVITQKTVQKPITTPKSSAQKSTTKTTTTTASTSTSERPKSTSTTKTS